MLLARSWAAEVEGSRGRFWARGTFLSRRDRFLPRVSSTCGVLGCCPSRVMLDHSGKTPMIRAYHVCCDVSPCRVQLLSGGHEGVLVQWNLSKGTRAYIPRLGGTIKVSERAFRIGDGCFLAADSCNVSTMTAHFWPRCAGDLRQSGLSVSEDRSGLLRELRRLA